MLEKFDKRLDERNRKEEGSKNLKEGLENKKKKKFCQKEERRKSLNTLLSYLTRMLLTLRREL
jgi:hypothetical protein